MKHYEIDQSCWGEVRIVLSPSDFMKAARLGGMNLEDEDILPIWKALQSDPNIRKEYADTVAWLFQTLLDEFAFQSAFRNPSPFINDKNR